MNWANVKVRELRNDAIDTQSRHFDYGQGYGETWEVVQPNGVYEDGHERYEQYEEPMMNFFYPLPSRPDGYDADDADKLADLPLCIIDDWANDQYGLALTGGGMDLSWEIAEAYVRLGFLPPSWIRLPRMAGMALYTRTRKILAAQNRSYRIIIRWMQGNIRDLHSTREYMRREG